MCTNKPEPKRFIGLDLHRYYVVATAVDEDLNKVYGPKRVNLIDLQEWIAKTVTPEDALVVEATANAFQVYDELLPHAHSVIVVHPPQVALVVRSQVKTDKIAAIQLARLLAKGLLTGRSWGCLPLQIYCRRPPWVVQRHDLRRPTPGE